MLDDLKNAFSYDPETGFLTWREVRFGAKAGERAGSVGVANGYRRICFRYKNYYAHRLAWMLHHNQLIPAGVEIDHINGDRDDNRACNLRLCTAEENKRNRRPSAGRKYKGVRFRAVTGKWEAAINSKGGSQHLGTFLTEAEAAAAYDAAARERHGEFARPNLKE